MIIAIARDGRIALLEAENFRGFHISSSIPRDDIERLAASLSGIGARIEDDHAWIPISWLKASAEGLGSSWLAGFDAMVTYARSKAWVDDLSEAIRAHIEWPGSA